MWRIPWQDIWRQERGFNLLEMTVAVFILGTSVIASVTILGDVAFSSAKSEGNVKLLQSVRGQIETLLQAPFEDDTTAYPTQCPPEEGESEPSCFPAIPEGFIVTISATTTGPSYSIPGLEGTLSSGLQQIVVEAIGDGDSLSMTFYKVRAP